jgi:hypothetical protein
LVVVTVVKVGVVMLVEMEVLVVEVPDMMEHKVHPRLRVVMEHQVRDSMVVLVEVLVVTEVPVVEVEVLEYLVVIQQQTQVVMEVMEDKYQLTELRPTTVVAVVVVIMAQPTEVKVDSVVVVM